VTHERKVVLFSAIRKPTGAGFKKVLQKKEVFFQETADYAD